MMKKAIIVSAILAMCGVGYAQTFVSTTPAKRTVLIEEFTGVGCTYCPLGHKSADQMRALYPGKVLSINVHQGFYASTYTTQWGNALASQAGINSYPTATMNRHTFGSGIQINAGEFYYRSQEIMALDAPVNVAAVVDINEATRLMKVTVEVYYTGNASSSTNLLNIALLQNNILGSQAGGSMFYPENMEGNKYRHNHMLRDLLTGQWGDTIPNTTQGSFFTKEYLYVIPQSLNGADIAQNFDDLEVIAFVCENHKEVLNAATAIRTGDTPRLVMGTAENEDCTLDFEPYVSVVNPSDKPITQMTLSVDGGEIVYNRTLNPYVTDTIHLASQHVGLSVDSMHNYVTSWVNIEKFTSQGREKTLGWDPLTFTYAEVDMYTVKGPLTFDIKYDEFPAEVSFSWDRMDDCSTVLAHTGTSAEEGVRASYTLETDATGLYRFAISDVGGDGLSGNIKMTDADGRVLFNIYATDLMRWEWYFNVTSEGMGIGDVAEEGRGCAVYPNPAVDRIHVEAASQVERVEVMDATGRVVASAQQPDVDVSHLSAGVYVVRVNTQEGTAMSKLIKK